MKCMSAVGFLPPSRPQPGPVPTDLRSVAGEGTTSRHAFTSFATVRNVVLPLVLLFWSAPAMAGGGPENVLLVVNSQSADSLLIANYYARLRQIPSDNVLYLRWDPKAQTTDVNTFRREILVPVLRTIDKRRLANQIDCILYSSDFPWQITFHSDLDKFVAALEKLPPEGKTGDKAEKDKPAVKPALPQHLTPFASITSLTYLWQEVAGGVGGYFGLRDNFYMRLSTASRPVPPSAGFRGNRQYNAEGEVVASGGRRYFLSMMLGVTAGRGNSPAEVLNYLQRSAAADGTHPRGTIYFMQNGDIRSKVRQPLFPAAAEELEKLGVTAVILDGTIPQNKNDVQGEVIGTANFDWKASGSTILPGAICEHFTSFGGIMTEGAGQTPLSEFLRYGAAGASGTVTEPHAIAEKFPSPMIQVHYARGCTLAEAFYQSVYGPYQLLIVGDPLCRPWADIPQVSVEGIKPGAVVRGRVVLKPAATLAHDAAIDHFEVFLDGMRIGECKSGATLACDTAPLADGYHELRVVAIGPEPIETQGRKIFPLRLANHGGQIEVSLLSQAPLRDDEPIKIAVRSPRAIGIAALQGSRLVGRISGGEGKIEIPPHTLAQGPSNSAWSPSATAARRPTSWPNRWN